MSKEKMSFKVLLKDKSYRKLFIATIISRFGDSIDMVAYAYMVYIMTGSPALMAILFAVNGIPSFVLSMFTGVAVAHMRKKKVVYICDALRGTVVLITGILYLYGGLEVWHLYVFTLLNSTLETFRAPAGMALFVNLVEDDKLEHATSLNTSGRTFAELIGYGFAGVLIGTVGVSGAIITDAITFILSALIIFTIKMDKEVILETKLTVKQYIVDFKEGYKYVMGAKFIRSLALFIGGIGFLFVPFNALQAAYVLETLQLDAIGISIMSISFMVSMIIGSLLVPSITKKNGGKTTFIIGGVVVGTGYFLFSILVSFSGQTTAYLMLALVSLIMGSTISFINTPITVALFRRVDRTLMTRVFAFINMLGLAAAPLGGAMVGGLVRIVNIQTLFFGFGIGVVLLFLLQIKNKSFDELNKKAEKAA